MAELRRISKKKIRESVTILYLYFVGVSALAAAPLDDAKTGLAALVRGDYEEAIAMNTRAIESGSLERESLAIAYYNRAMGYKHLAKPKRAEEDFKRAYGAWPEHPMTQEAMRDLGLLATP